MSKQPDKFARAELEAIVSDRPLRVAVRGTRRSVKIRGIKPYTIERLTRLWVSRDLTRPDDSASTLRSLCKDPYFNHKQAALFMLNGYARIRLLYGIVWRWWAYVRQWEEWQLTDVIVAAKKKIPLRAYWTNMALTADMRNDWMTMTAKEAAQYQADAISAAARLSSKSTPDTEDR